MATASTATIRHIGLGHKLAHAWGNMVEGLAKGRAYTRTVDELAALGDRELHDLGINRSEIADTAWSCVYGTRRTA